MNKLYSVHDHWTDINKKNDVDIESIDGVITGIKVNGEDYGGGEYQNIYDNTINTVLDSDGFYTTNIGVVIEADSIRVTFDGVEYSCPKRSISEISTNFYGAPTPLETGEESFDWTNFPFSIVTGSDGASMVVTTQTAGTHTLKIEEPQSGGGSDFSTAEVTVSVNNDEMFYMYDAIEIIDNEMLPSAGFESGNYTLVLYKGSIESTIEPPEGYTVSNATTTGGITITQTPYGARLANITGDGTLTVELTHK